MTFSPYQSLEVLEVIDLADRKGGRRWFVRDDDEAQFWCLVEYMGLPGLAGRRLVCWCDDGIARQEDEGEPECRHFCAVIAHLAMARRASGPPLGTLVPSLFTD